MRRRTSALMMAPILPRRSWPGTSTFTTSRRPEEARRWGEVEPAAAVLSLADTKPAPGRTSLARRARPERAKDGWALSGPDPAAAAVLELDQIGVAPRSARGRIVRSKL